MKGASKNEEIIRESAVSRCSNEYSLHGNDSTGSNRAGFKVKGASKMKKCYEVTVTTTTTVKIHVNAESYQKALDYINYEMTGVDIMKEIGDYGYIDELNLAYNDEKDEKPATEYDPDAYNA